MDRANVTKKRAQKRAVRFGARDVGQKISWNTRTVGTEATAAREFKHTIQFPIDSQVQDICSFRSEFL